MEIKSYKGFNRDMTCKGKQYEEGKDYEEPQAVACEKGMRACEYPLDCFSYYAPGNSVYHEVIQSGEISRHQDNAEPATAAQINTIKGLCEKHNINYPKLLAMKGVEEKTMTGPQAGMILAYIKKNIGDE